MEYGELFPALMELNNKQVIMVLTASQNRNALMHICGKLKVTKSSIIEFMVGDAVVRADTVHREQIDRRGGSDIREIVFWMNNVDSHSLMNGVHCSIRPGVIALPPIPKLDHNTWRPQ